MAQRINPSCALCVGACCGGAPGVSVRINLRPQEVQSFQQVNPRLTGEGSNKYALRDLCGYGERLLDGSVRCAVYGDESRRPRACCDLKPDSPNCISFQYRAGLL